MRSMPRPVELPAALKFLTVQILMDELQSISSGVKGKAMYPKMDVIFRMIREILNTSRL